MFPWKNLSSFKLLNSVFIFSGQIIMTKKNIDEQYELFERWKLLKHDLEFTKIRQWKNIYYSTLLFASLIYLNSEFSYIISHCIKFHLALIIAFISIYFQFRHFFTMRKYRLKLEVVDSILSNNWKDKLDKIYKEKKIPLQSKYESLIFLIIFVFIIMGIMVITMSI